MLTEERKQKILYQLEQNTIVKSQDLVELLKASESTIRRDLQEMEDDGLLVRIHGGAKKNQELSQEPNMQEKTFKNEQQKQKIAALAASEINDEDVIYLDAGTSTLKIIPFLKGKKITVVTNSVVHAAKLIELEIKTLILGGEVKLSTNAVLGAETIHQLSRFRFNKSFMGINGVHPTFGYTTPDPEEAAVKRTAFDCSEEVFILADQSKFNRITFTKVADIEEATILTEQVSPDDADKLSKKTTIKAANS